MDDVNESLYMPHRPTERGDEWQGPIWNDCGTCNYTRRDLSRGNDELRWCFWCERDAMERLRTLAHNLAIAAGLCRAFKLGNSVDEFYEGYVDRGMPLPERIWWPGCGRSAP